MLLLLHLLHLHLLLNRADVVELVVDERATAHAVISIQSVVIVVVAKI
jgi:hypothetical protein